ALTQLDLLRRVERRQVRAGGPDAERERFPPLVEVRMLHLNRQSSLLDLPEAGLREELDEVALAAPGQPRFVRCVGIELMDGLPERRQRRLSTGVIPHACGDHSPGA